MVLLAVLVGAIGAAFPSEKPAFVETAVHWYAPRQTMRAATELLGMRPDDKPVAWVAYKVADLPCDTKGDTQVVLLYPVESVRLGEIVLKYNTRRDSNGVTKVFLGDGRVEGCLLPSSDGRWRLLSTIALVVGI